MIFSLDSLLVKLLCSPASNAKQAEDMTTVGQYTKSCFFFWVFFPNYFHANSTNFLSTSLNGKR